jgi:hypothetical protein
MVDGDVVKIGPRAIPFTFRDERGHVHEWIAVAALVRRIATESGAVDTGCECVRLANDWEATGAGTRLRTQLRKLSTKGMLIAIEVGRVRQM